MHREARYRAFLDYLRYQLDVHYNFTIDTIKDDDAIPKFLEQFNEDAGLQPVFESDIYPTRPLKSNTHSLLNDKQVMLMINDSELAKCKRTGSLIIHEPDDWMTFLSRILFGKQSFEYSKEIPINQSFKWEDLKTYSNPCTDILLVDRYLLMNREKINKNLIPLMKMLAQGITIKLNIVLINGDEDPIKYEEEIQKILKKIRDEIKEVTGLQPNCTLILLDGKNYEHDRFIITNYLRYDSGDSFSGYFDSSGNRTTKGRFIRINNLAHKETFINTSGLIYELNKSVSDIIKRHKNLRIFGDKVSNFIQF